MAENIASIATDTMLLDKYDLHAKKKYGQNFLVSGHVADRICSLVPEGANVLEIGPGLGALSERLQSKAGRYIGYEIDEDMVNVLSSELPQLDIRRQDFMETSLDMPGKWTAVSNLPYYLTADILWKIFSNAAHFDRVIVMVQKEVADKFSSGNMGKDYNALSVLMQYYCEAETVCRVSRNDFIPRPNVDSAVICFTMKDGDLIHDDRFTELVQQAFAQRRKKLLSNLKPLGITAETLTQCGLEESVRAEQLSWRDYVNIYEVHYDIKSVRKDQSES